MNGAELKAFAVSWEARGMPRGGFSSGARRIFAIDAKDAVERGRELIAKDNAWPIGNVRILEVRPIDNAIEVQ